ncbi:signal peptidase II [Maribacter sp. 2307ULW6-5]|uniref:signal peptidase II n=1 Tax=Maribacter sp. 2307ULW6-5 TaxID=3386275 RepID=UPI0039BCEA71
MNRFYVLVLVLLNLGCDQITKEAVRQNVTKMEQIELFSGQLILTHVENTGAMLGFGAHLPKIPKLILLQVIPLAVLLLLIYLVFLKNRGKGLLAVAFAFALGGGIGNLMDRIAHGSVTDFFQIRLGMFRSGIFNMADVSLTVGLLLLFIGHYVKERKKAGKPVP